MRFTETAQVYGADQHEVGRITRLVLKPEHKQATHIVVRQGVLFIEEKVIPIEYFQDADDGQAILHDYLTDLEDFPTFQETNYVPVEFTRGEGAAHTIAVGGGWAVNPIIDYSPEAPDIPDQRYKPGGQYAEAIRQNISSSEIALRLGARMTSEDERTVGHIESVLVDSQTSNIRYFESVRGFLWKTRRRVPAFWCDIISDDEVRVSLNMRDFEGVPEL